MDTIIDALSRCGAVPNVIQIADIGAMSCGQSDTWSQLVNQGRAHLLGFEPQKEECDRCNATAGAGRLYLPTALGDGTTRLFHRCRFAPTSSFYKPNIDVIARYNGLAAQMEVVETLPIPTKRLDDIEQARRTDFLKLDVQGSELDILAHATKTLEHVSMIQIEVCFLPLYQEQPLFADIDAFLRKQGFELHTFIGFGTRMLLPLSSADLPNAQTKQTLWSDAVYLKSLNHERAELDPTSLLKRAILLHELYQSYDFAARDLKDHDRITGKHTFRAYASMLRMQEAA